MTDSRPIRMRREARAVRLHYEAALLGTLLLHGVLLYGLRVNPRLPHHVLPTSEPECILVSPIEESLPWEKKIHAWCLLADPTLLSLPNEELGFGYLRRSERILPVTGFPAFELSVPAEAETPTPKLRLSDPFAPLDTEIEAKWQYARIPIPTPPPTAELPARLLWRYPDGVPLAEPPGIDPEAINRALATGPTPTSPTRIELAHQGRRARIMVRESSGNKALDLLVDSALRRAFFQVECRGPYLNTQDPPPYYPKAGQSVHFEVEWRLLAQHQTPPSDSP